MSKTGKFSTHHILDEGVWYTPGETVRVDESGRNVQIVRDPAGEYEVYSCRHATEFTGGPSLLRIGLRKGSLMHRAEPLEAPFKPHVV